MATSIRSNGPPTRRDLSGIPTRRLTYALEAGAILREQAGTIHSDAGVRWFTQRHRGWVLDCLPVLADVFEVEAFDEFVHANTGLPRDLEPHAAARAAVEIMDDAIELLAVLRASLRHQD